MALTSTRYRLKKLCIAMLPVALAFVFTYSGSHKAMGQGEQANYAGIEQCATCHEDTVKAFKETLHGKKGFEMKSDKACETCHGPGAAHIEGGGDKTKIKVISSLNAEEKSKICLGCHENGNRMYWIGGMHESRGLACTDCHSVHNPKSEKAQLVKEKVTQLCFTCHKQKEAQFYRASHHPVREGKMECTNCHNPHGTQTEKMVKADSTNELCYTCHAEKRGPFLWEHMPVRESCTNCHEVHGSNHPSMLNVKQPFLCQRCHSDTRHPGTLYDQTAVASNSNRIINRSCTNCHASIHGSNHPSGRTFLR
jgi:DmsE family decaheme c-type cytochrome